MPTGYIVPAPPQVAADATVVAKAADYTVVAADMGKIFTNTGAAGTITLTLPAAAGAAGQSLKVQLTVAQVVRLDPAGTEKAYLGGDGVAGKYVNIAGVIGNYVDIHCDGEKWLVLNYSGVLTKEA